MSDWRHGWTPWLGAALVLTLGIGIYAGYTLTQATENGMASGPEEQRAEVAGEGRPVRKAPVPIDRAPGGKRGAAADGVVVLVDRTPSVQGVRERMLANLGRVLEALEQDVRLIILPIEANSAVSPVIYDVVFPRREGGLFGENEHTHRARAKRLRAHAAQAVQVSLSDSAGQRTGTAIIDAIAQAATHLGRVPGKRRLVILSDMVEQSEVVDLTGLAPDAVDQLMAGLEQEGRLPDLGRTEIYAAGITDGDSGWMSTAQVHLISGFWARFFEQAGATLCSYSPSLTDFGKCDARI